MRSRGTGVVASGAGEPRVRLRAGGRPHAREFAKTNVWCDRCDWIQAPDFSEGDQPAAAGAEQGVQCQGRFQVCEVGWGARDERESESMVLPSR